MSDYEDLNIRHRLLAEECETLRAELAAARGEVARCGDLMEALVEAVDGYFDPPVGRRKTWPGNVYMAHRAAWRWLNGVDDEPPAAPEEVDGAQS